MGVKSQFAVREQKEKGLLYSISAYKQVYFPTIDKDISFRMNSDLNRDRISSLPKNVIEAILLCLPIRDAVRTSMLSRGWRYEWSTLPEIVIDGESFICSKGLPQTEFDQKFVKIVDHILLLHHGPIHKFTLSIDLGSCTDIDRWILFLSRNGIKKFTLDKWKGHIYKLPSCLFSCADITYLELYRCKFIPPTSFKGFSRLQTMDLQQVTFTDNGLSTLLSDSPLMKIVVLKDLNGCTRLKISAQELVELTIVGAFSDIHVESTPLLATASINLLAVSDEPLSANKGGSRIAKVLGHIPSIRKLKLLDNTLQNMAVGDVPFYLPEICPVKNLLIHINFEDMQGMLAAFCIFRSSPAMEELDIWAISDKNIARTSSEGFWVVEEDLKCTFSHLKVVEVTDFAGIPSELKLIEFILANAPVLEKLHIKFKKDVSDMLKIFRELIRCPRSSPKAEVFVPA